MKIVIKINQSATISFGEIFQMRECVCACLSELNLSEEFYIPTSNQLSQNLHAAYKTFCRRMKLKYEI